MDHLLSRRLLVLALFAVLLLVLSLSVVCYGGRLVCCASIATVFSRDGVNGLGPGSDRLGAGAVVDFGGIGLWAAVVV